LQHEELAVGVSPACRGSNDAISPVWWRWRRGLRWCGAQSADHLDEKRWKRQVVGEVVCVLGATVSVVVAVLAAGPIYWHP